jgi:molecular chaperone GrpE
MLVQAMEKFEIEEIDPTGEKFDPEFHQAMSMQEIEGQETNTVVSVMQKGYRLGERLLRPALVMVAK